MKIVVMHNSPDWDAITSYWLIKHFLPGWQEAGMAFVPAGQRLANGKWEMVNGKKDPIEKIDGDDVIHVDTGMGPLDHHQTSSDKVCAASLTWDFVKKDISGGEKWEDKSAAIQRIVNVVVDIDHFKEVFWENTTADYHEFSLIELLDGIKLLKPDQDEYYVRFGIECLDGLLHNFENRIWAEREIANNGNIFAVRPGKGIGFVTVNDTVLPLSQKMGYVLVIRKDPRKGYVRIKARPPKDDTDASVDLTPAYEALKARDPQATWFLHASKRMVLNGTTKNPKMRPTQLRLEEIIDVLKKSV